MVADAHLAAEPIRPLRRAEYDQLVEAGAFVDEKLELLQGMIVKMSPQGARHAFVVEALTGLLVLAAGARARVRVQLPLAVSDDSEPEPDFAVVAAASSPRSHPTTALLVVEVAETSLARDRGLKAGLYAGALVAEYWVVDLAGDLVEVHRDPVGGRYTTLTSHRRGDVLRPIALAGTSIEVAAFLPASA